MENKTIGTILTVKKQWWLKVNTKPLRRNAFDGALFPHIVKVQYSVNGVAYIRQKWIGAGTRCPDVNTKVTVIYRVDKPEKFRLDLPKCYGDVL